MTDDLVKQWDDYVESVGGLMPKGEQIAQQMRDRIEALTAERDRAIDDARDNAEYVDLVSRYRAERVAAEKERDEYKRSALHSGDVVKAAKAEIDRLRSLLAEADRRIVWEGHGLGSDFTERVEAALKGQQPADRIICDFGDGLTLDETAGDYFATPPKDNSHE